MMKHLLSACTLLLAVTTSSAQTFFLDDNGITIKCIDCVSGDTGIVNGIEYTAVDNAALQAAVDDGLIPLSQLCTSLVTSTASLFFGDSDFNADITSWDMSGVTSTKGMFHGASSFNQPIGHWDVSSVTDMRNMFNGCEAFNQPLEAWDVSAVTFMSWMFRDCDVFNQPLEAWDVSSVITMEGMFYECKVFNEPLEAWDVSSVVDMYSMFYWCEAFNQPLEAWNVSSVLDMQSMFRRCKVFNQPLGGWDVSSVNDMSEMLSGCWAFNQPLEAWDVSSVVDMERMFNNCWVFNHPLEDWDVSSVLKMGYMFSSCDAFDQPLEAWDVSSVTDMRWMFQGCEAFNQPLEAWDVSAVTVMTNIFSRCEVFDQPLGGWDVSSVLSMEGMFLRCFEFNQPLEAWDVSSVIDMSSMFYTCEAFNQPLESWDVSSVTDMQNMFTGCDVFNQSLLGWDVSGVTDMDFMMSGANSFDQDISNWCVSGIPFEPYHFNANGGQLSPSQLPVWGECPGCVVPEGNCNCQSVDADNDSICDSEDCSFQFQLCLSGPQCSQVNELLPFTIPQPSSGFFCYQEPTETICTRHSLFIPDMADSIQLSGFYINLEHQSLQELNATIICPEGVGVPILSCQAGGGGRDLGVDGGADYFWIENSAMGTMANSPYDYLPSATYEIDGDWTDLETCSTSGIWTLEVCDTYGNIATGVVYDWGVVLEDAEGEISMQTASCATSIGCLDDSACNYDSQADYDNGQCEFVDECGVCGGEGDQLDACGVCNGPGPIYECGCSPLPEGNCDCESIDSDGDGICDSVDDCFSLEGDPSSCCETAIAQFDCMLDGIGFCSDTLQVVGLQELESLEIYFSFTPLGGAAWPGDLALQLIPPTGDSLLMGGYWGGISPSDVGGEYLGDHDQVWGWPSGSLEGVYTQVIDLSAYDLIGEGEWIIALWNTWGGSSTWQVDVVLHGVCGQEGVSCVNDADGDGICDFEDDCIGEYDACGVCGGDGIAEGACDCDGNQLDALGVCGGDCAADADADGICDDVDECVGALDGCGICNGPGGIYECGCSDIPAGDCDCEGNQLDALGVCGGDCVWDVNGNGICDLEELSESMCGQGTVWNEELGVCVVALPTDANFDGCVGINDLLELLAFYGQGECFTD